MNKIIIANWKANPATLEEALELFKVPFDLNEFEGKPVSVGVGRFGP